MPERSFLFLQGHATPFYLRLGQALDRAGHEVRRINICGGDRLFWGDWHAEDFHGPLPELGAAVSETARRRILHDNACEWLRLPALETEVAEPALAAVNA